MSEQSREKNQAAWDRYHARKALRLAREAREQKLVGKVVKEVKRRAGLILEGLSEKINPSDSPWEDDDFMVM